RALAMLRRQAPGNAFAELAGAFAEAPFIAGKTVVSSLVPRPNRSGRPGVVAGRPPAPAFYSLSPDSP
ncbi:MAG: hypothetical protein QOF34_13, partial [Sphingomonadales bacterium]|nr:hypothetical protein [Sphingomonadales bacterium]